MTSAARACLVAALAMASMSCGSGGSSPPPPPPPPSGPIAPTFTSPSAVTVQENFSGVVLTVAATDPDSAVLTFGSVIGGPDASRFSFNPTTRELRFNVAPDFEAPTDDDFNNTYRITLSVSDGTTTVLQNVVITVSNVINGFRVRRVAAGLSQPIFVAGLPDGTGRIVVVERAGRIRVLNPATGAFGASDFLNLTGQIDTTGEKGLLAIAFSNTYATDRTFYLHLNPNTANTTEIRQYRAPAATDVADPASGNPILVVPQTTASNHKGGFLAMDPLNRLLVGLGDGGNTPNAAQDPNSLLGKVLRIDPATDAFPADPNRDYTIPAANGFSGGGGAPEIFWMGLRNPFRGSLDLATNSVFIGDVGEGAIEEVDRALITATTVLNYGWNRREGTQPFNGGADDPNFIRPVAEYAHGSGADQGNSVTGGVVYRGPVDDLQGQYIFADFISRNIWTIPVASLLTATATTTTVPSSAFTNRNVAMLPDVGTIDQIAHIGTDASGNVYFVDLGGEIFRIETP